MYFSSLIFPEANLENRNKPTIKNIANHIPYIAPAFNIVFVDIPCGSIGNPNIDLDTFIYTSRKASDPVPKIGYFRITKRGTKTDEIRPNTEAESSPLSNLPNTSPINSSEDENKNPTTHIKQRGNKPPEKEERCLYMYTK